MVRAAVTTLFSYHDADQMLQEYQFGGILHTWNNLWTYDVQLRRTKMRVRQGTTVHSEQDYAYDAASRLETVTDNTDATVRRATTYDYLANPSLIGQITFRENTTDRMTTTRQHDRFNRLESISSAHSAESLPLAYNYVYNNASFREIQTHRQHFLEVIAEMVSRFRVRLGGAEFLAGLKRHVIDEGQEQRGARRWMAERPAFATVIAAVEQVKGRKWAEFRDEYGETGRDMALYLGRRLCGMKLAELAEAVDLRNYGVVATNAKRYESDWHRTARRKLE